MQCRDAQPSDGPFAQPAVELFDAPVGPFPPRTGVARAAERGTKLAHELDERLASIGPARVRGERAQPRDPVLVAADAGSAADPLPFGGA